MFAIVYVESRLIIYIYVGDFCLLVCISDHDWLYRTRE